MTSAPGAGDAPDAPPADEKDWTWVLDRPCAECGFDAGALDLAELPARVAAATSEIARAATAPGGTDRPRPGVWSALEYACHVRDVCRLFDDRVRLMLTQDDPQFANWDQDATAVELRYREQDPATVAGGLTTAATAVTESFVGVGAGGQAEQWSRPGRRSNGSVFTVDTLARYFLHDLVHHAHDVRP